MSLIFNDAHDFVQHYTQACESYYGRSFDELEDTERLYVLSALVANRAKALKVDSKAPQKEVYYFSLEFLIGPLLDNYLLNLGIRDMVEAGVKELGSDLDTLISLEVDPGLGNGGLGRLAACFMDSCAALGVAGNGMGMRYHYGLFRQAIEGGRQVEHMDNWLQRGYPWETRKMADSVLVQFGGEVRRHEENGHFWFTQEGGEYVRAVPYDVPLVGYGARAINNLRLWSAEPAEERFDLAAFNAGNYAQAQAHRASVEAISQILYPNDSGEHGRLLRLKQEYLFVCAGLHSILSTFEKKHGPDYAHLPDFVAIHTNDTHPAICGPELMRILVDEKGVEFDDAFEICKNTLSYTNHTVMPEALECWPIAMFRSLLPCTYMFIEEIDRRFHETFPHDQNNWQDVLSQTAMLWDGVVRMANVSVIFSHSVNGVSELHTQILEDETLHGFYTIYPERFNNKTNGISHRRFLANANPSYASLITRTIGDSWLHAPDKLAELKKFEDDHAFLDEFEASKKTNKERLARYIQEQTGVVLDTSMIFDVQVKRFHAYKRQLLNVMKIIDIYNRLLANEGFSMHPTAFIFAGKAAQSYVFAKEVIRLINSVADVINNDPRVNQIIKIAFVPNFSVSNASLIYPACEISEQISWAGSEASGTSNMKLMMNGAWTLGTYDGANIEIADLVGPENIKIFGLRAEEVERLRSEGKYWSWELYNNDRVRLGKIIDQLTDGSFARLSGNFEMIHDCLMVNNDHDLVLADFYDYVKAWQELTRSYEDRYRWNKACVHNTACSGYFSSDRTIREYARDIWHVEA